MSPDRVLQLGTRGVLTAVALSGIAYLVLGFDIVEHVAALPGCLARALSGVPCPGCGMTRAFLLLGQLRLEAGIAQHPLAPGLLAATLWLALGRRLPRSRWLVGGALVAVLAVWVGRLAVGGSGA